MDPICPDNCADTALALPPVKFDDCNPEVNSGEIEEIFLGIRGVGFTDINSAAEWASRLAATDDTKLIRLTVIADKPRPAANSTTISGNRKRSLPAEHIINVTIDETNAINHAFIRSNQCSGNYQAWYKTSGGIGFGGNDGLSAFLDLDMTIPRERAGFITYDGTLAWTSRFTEERTTLPIA